jgi:hypothetical protein
VGFRRFLAALLLLSSEAGAATVYAAKKTAISTVFTVKYSDDRQTYMFSSIEHKHRAKRI